MRGFDKAYREYQAQLDRGYNYKILSDEEIEENADYKEAIQIEFFERNNYVQ